ncbi:hypothetical protein [Cupriavidus sp. USMAA2-4]|uniref:hypothetical protein n=1 Tax=Cupriavidus sp. USMAA2-4 TaxID=876364 RepID=UPI0012F52154|nr:hypothetical protein [Cupriavidus sp. USMAA2-4]
MENTNNVTVQEVFANDALAGLSEEAVNRLRIIVGEFNVVRKRAACDLFQMCVLVAEIKQLVGRNFKAVAEELLGISGRTAERYIKAASGFRRLNDGSSELFPRPEQFTMGALELLENSTDTVVHEVLELAEKGESINDAVVRQLTSRNHELTEDLQEARESLRQQDAKIAEAERQLDISRRNEKDTHTIVVAKQKDIDELVEVVQQHETEKADLRRALDNRQVVEKIVERIPEGFTSASDAVDFLRRDMDRLNGEIRHKKDELDSLQREKDAIGREAEIVSVVARTRTSVTESVGNLIALLTARAGDCTDEIWQGVEVVVGELQGFATALKVAAERSHV